MPGPYYIWVEKAGSQEGQEESLHNLMVKRKRLLEKLRKAERKSQGSQTQEMIPPDRRDERIDLEQISHHIRAGQELFCAGRYKQAIAEWRRVMEVADEDTKAEIRLALAEACFRLGLQEHSLGNTDAALTYLHQAAAAVPEKAVYHYHLGLAFHRMANMKRAEECFERALALEPDNVRFLFQKGLIYAREDARRLRQWMKGPEGGILSCAQRYLLEVATGLRKTQEISGASPESARGLPREVARLAAPPPVVTAPPSNVTAASSTVTAPSSTVTLAPMEEGDGAGGDKVAANYPYEAAICLLKGLKAYGEGDLDGALFSFLQAGKIDPSNPYAHFYAGFVHLNQGDFTAAEAECEKAKRLNLRHPDMGQGLAAAFQGKLAKLAEEGNVDALIDLLEKEPGVNTFPESPDRKRGLALAYFVRGNRNARSKEWERAIRDWERAAKLTPDEPDVFHNLALAHEEIEDTEDAIRYWRRTIDLWTSLLQGESGKVASRSEEIRECLSVAYRHLANLLSDEGRVEESLMGLELAVKYNPHDPNLRLELAGALFAADSQYKAMSELEALLRQDATNVKALLLLGRIYEELERREEAVKTWMRALDIEPENPAIRRLLVSKSLVQAAECIDNGDFPKAEEWLKSAISLGPEYVHELVAVGITFYRLGEKAESRRWFARAVKSAGDNPHEFLAIAEAYLMVGRMSLTERYIRQALDVAPYNPEVLLDAGKMYLKMRMEAKATGLFNEALAKAGHELWVHREIFEICCEHRACDLAIEYLKKTIEAFPDMPGPRLSCLSCLVEQDRFSEAADVVAEGREVVEKSNDKEDIRRWRSLAREVEREIEGSVYQ